MAHQEGYKDKQKVSALQTGRRDKPRELAILENKTTGKNKQKQNKNTQKKHVGQ